MYIRTLLILQIGLVLNVQIDAQKMYIWTLISNSSHSKHHGSTR